MGDKAIILVCVMLILCCGCLEDTAEGGSHENDYVRQAVTDTQTNIPDDVINNTTVLSISQEIVNETVNTTPVKKVVSVQEASERNFGDMTGGKVSGSSGTSKSKKHHSSSSDSLSKSSDDKDDVYVNPYATTPVVRNYPYTLRGVKGSIPFTVYGGLNDYLDALPSEITYYHNEPTSKDFTMRNLDEPNQKVFLDQLVTDIQNITPVQDDQARIAISLVQNIPYDWDSAYVYNNISNKYPYEVLYTDKGVCGQKTELLAYLLRGLGYEVAILDFDIGDGGHEALGLRCPMEYSYSSSGYAFVEATSVTIITDSNEKYYIDSTTLAPLPLASEIYKISDGGSFDSVFEEYNDNIEYDRLYAKMNSYGSGRTLPQAEYNEWKATHDAWMKIVNKYGIKLSS